MSIVPEGNIEKQPWPSIRFGGHRKTGTKRTESRAVLAVMLRDYKVIQNTAPPAPRLEPPHLRHQRRSQTALHPRAWGDPVP